MSTLKYAMTLDGKIATHTGHAAWVSNASSRQRVFDQRAAADCVIVGGNTVRRDNPRLTTRRDSGHRPARVVMSRTLDLPEVRLESSSPGARCFSHATDTDTS
jgi:diaminohydroxyphosphoribosylaminopyrimidine deaminase / 5-amino-6-(5-phosphoribosylamino)uracil reductase